MQIFKGKSYSDTRKNFSEKNFGNFLNFDSIYGGGELSPSTPSRLWRMGYSPPVINRVLTFNSKQYV